MFKFCFTLVALFLCIAIVMTTINGGYWLGCTITLGDVLRHPLVTLAAVAVISFIVYLF